MAQFDVYKNPNEKTQKQFPYLLDVQNDLHSRMQSRLIVPLAIGVPPIKYLTPQIRIEAQEVVMSTMDMTSVIADSMGDFVVNVKEYRVEIEDALDFLVNGF